MVNTMKFFDREKEIEEFINIINREPDDIYFIFGPINSGKTVLIIEIINNMLDKNKYVVFYINLRGIFISKYEFRSEASSNENFQFSSNCRCFV
ncbi:Chromosomal replication initiator protein DnaA [Methanocaldococcus lauensis]|nr:Chromosomal replication initiator protein DnaA [Methanocaldococcus lauensis]